MARLSPARVRLVASFGDQGLSSAQNFALLVLVARAVYARDFGVFTLYYTVLSLAIQVGQAFLGEPLLLKYATAGETELRLLRNRVFSLTLMLGLFLTALPLLLSLAIPSQAHELRWVALVPIPLLLQDLTRFFALTGRQPFVLLYLDAVWTGLWLALYIIISPDSPGANIALWGATAAVPMLAGIAYWRVRPASLPAAWRTWHEELWPSARSLMSEFAVSNSTTQITPIMVTGICGLAATGGLRAAQGLFGPLNVLLNALRLAVVPEIIRAGGSKSAKSKRLLTVVMGGGVVVALAVGIFLQFLPTHYGVDLLGQTWHYAQPLTIALTATRVIGAITNGPLAALRADGRLREMAIARAISAVATLLGVLFGALLDGVSGSAWGLAISSLVTVAANFWFERQPVKSVNEATTSPVLFPSPPEAGILTP